MQSTAWRRSFSRPRMQTVGARADLQSLRDRARFLFLKKAKRLRWWTRGGAGSTAGFFLYESRCVYTRTRWDATVGRKWERESGTGNSLILPQGGEKGWGVKSNESLVPTATGPKNSKCQVIWQRSRTLPQEIHSLIIHEVALYRDGGNRVTEQENWVNRCTGETHTCIPLDFVSMLHKSNPRSYRRPSFRGFDCYD